MATLIAGAVLVAALTVVLRTEEAAPGLRQWNLVLWLVLALPVSHLSYALLALPPLWTWISRQVRGHREWRRGSCAWRSSFGGSAIASRC